MFDNLLLSDSVYINILFIITTNENSLNQLTIVQLSI